MAQAVWSLLIKLDDSCAHDALVISAIAVLSSVALRQLGGNVQKRLDGPFNDGPIPEFH